MLKTVLAAVLLLNTPLTADQLRISSSADWRRWDLPGDAVEVSQGSLKPAFVRRDINAVADAGDFAGGIRQVGSNPQDAADLIDGNLDSYWAPAAGAPVEDWWIEVDLGRVVSAQKIELHFAADSTPLEFFKILTSDGEPFFSNANSVIPGTLRYNKRWRYSFNTDHVIEIDFGLKPLKNIRIEADLPTAGVRLAEVVVTSIGDNISLGLWDRGGQAQIISEITSKIGRTLIESTGISGALVDGDITTYWGTVHRGGSGTQPEQQIGQFQLDLGALYWIDRVRMLGDASGVSPGKGSGRHRAGVFNYLWYRFYVSDGSLAPDGSLKWELLGELPADPRNLRQVVHFQELFTLRKARHVRLVFPMSDGLQAFNGRIGTTAEWQVFGEGYPAEVVARSPLYDLGGAQHIESIRWQLDAPAQTRVEIRSRTGNLLDEEYTFFDKNGKAVTEKKFNRLIPSFRGRIDTTRTPGADWSNWSRAYEESGQLFLSPGPRRYVQLEARALSETPFAAATLDEIVLEYNNPLAQHTRAEVFPVQVPPAEESRFTYFLDVEMAANSRGFDQIRLTSTAGAAFEAVRIGGEAVAVGVEETADGFTLQLAAPVRRSVPIEVDFSSTVFLNQTRFDGFILNSALSNTVRQQIDAGDANGDVASDRVFVSLPIDGRLYAGLSLSSPVLTPNGDGVNDRLRIEFDLLKVLDPRPVEIGVYDLSGRRVAAVSDGAMTAGRQVAEWDGRDGSGRTVPPGVYLLRVFVEGDALTRARSRLVTVAY